MAAMTADRTAKRRALVVGLGIAGIASALRLRRSGWDVVVVEKAAERRRGGYFIALFGAGIGAAARLGIETPDHSNRDGKAYNFDRKGRRRPGLSYSDLPGKARWLVRGDIEDAAFNALPDEVEIRYSTSPQALRQDAEGVDVDMLDAGAGTTRTERFDLVVGADGLRSTVRRLAFEPAEARIHRLGYMIATCSLTETAPGFRPQDAMTLHEPGRSVWIFSFADRPATVLFTYRTNDVDAEFTRPPIESLRTAFGPQPTGPVLGWLLDQFEKAPDHLFDSAEQVRLDRWHRGRVVLVGDAAWCLTLYSGMGASASLAGAELLGAMLDRHPEDMSQALSAWEVQLRPFIDYHVGTGINQRRFFVQADRAERLVLLALMKLMRVPVVGKLFAPVFSGKDEKMKTVDIASGEALG